jgi:hypothetical protein
VRRRMCMSDRINIELTEEDVDELVKMIDNTLRRFAQIVLRHSEVINTGDINLIRSFLDELLISYTSVLLRTHLKLLQVTMDEVSGDGKESGVL